MKPGLVLQHGDWGPPAILGDWAAQRGIPLTVHRMDHDPVSELDSPSFVASLGSKYSPADTQIPAVACELELIDQAVRTGVPVLGLCFGGQVLATVLGGEVQRAPEPELGWHRVHSRVPELVSEGPWLQWHYERFTLPPGAHELASSERALQAFADGPHLGVQFHPESTIEIVQEWARLDGERLQALGIEDGEGLVEAGRRYARAARAGAFKLFDAFWERACQPERSPL